MATLIKNKRVAQNPWLLLKAEDTVPATGDVIVPLAVWTTQREALLKRMGSVGVLLENTDDPRSLVTDFAKLGVIAVRFPKFTDGRAYSQARLLRERLGYTGELRATGVVLRDQLPFLLRCGFDSFESGQPGFGEALGKARTLFSVVYQPVGDGRITAGELRLRQLRQPASLAAD